MLNYNKQETFDGAIAYGDDREFNKYYLLPEQPRFRVDDKGKPIFKFLKYKFPIDRPDGRKGGGYVTFDVEFSVPDDKLQVIKEKLQERVAEEAARRRIDPVPSLVIGNINYTEGTSQLNIMSEDGVFVERIHDAGVPSLFGKNISTYAIELSPEGATLFEQALQGQGGFVSVTYQLKHEAKFPPVHAWARFNASAFYSFVQDIDVEERACREDEYQETLTDIMSRSESREIHIDPGSAQVDSKVIDEVRSMMIRSLDEAVERLLIEALPVEDPEDARKWYRENDIEDVRKEVMRFRASSYRMDYKEETIVQVPINPQGLMPNITTLTDKEGNPIKWEDYAQEIDLNDPFFQQIRVAVQVKKPDYLPISNVEVKLNYNGQPMNVLGSEIDGEFSFDSPDQVAQFASFMVNGNNKYTYSYQVNYVGESRIYQSPEIETDERTLTINVDDMGILDIDIKPGDLNFQQVKQAQLVLRYEDRGRGVGLIEQQYILDENTPSHRFQEVIFADRAQPYQYRVKYFMKDGKEYQMDWVDGESPDLYINDPFSSMKRVGARAAGDLDTEIESIFVDLIYNEEENNYQQSTSIVLSRNQPFFDWEFPVIDESKGVVSYMGSIVYKDGTTEEIPETVTSSNTPLIGENIQDRMAILLLADMLDFSELKMARVQLRYSDPDNGIFERKDFVFSPSRPREQTWNLKLKNKAMVDYEWEATFYMNDGSTQVVQPTVSDDLTLILEAPSVSIP